MKKLWDLKKLFSNLEPEGQGRGIIIGVTRLLLLGLFYTIQTKRDQTFWRGVYIQFMAILFCIAHWKFWKYWISVFILALNGNKKISILKSTQQNKWWFDLRNWSLRNVSPTWYIKTSFNLTFFSSNLEFSNNLGCTLNFSQKKDYET